MRYAWFDTCCMRNQGKNYYSVQSKPLTSFVTFATILINGGLLFTWIIFCIFLYSGFFSASNGSLFSICLLYSIMDIAWCIAMVLISLKVHHMVFLRILNFSFIIFIEEMCVDALANVVITISGSLFHPLLVMLSISGWYFSIFVIIVSQENLSLQYVNSMNCILRLLLGAIGGFDWYDSLLTYMMSGLNLALQWHLWCPHVQGSSHGGIVFFGELLLNAPAFIKI